ncbi:hypothetical protein [Geodermatophilus sp. URMC 63]
MTKFEQIILASDWYAVIRKPSTVPGRADGFDEVEVPLVAWARVADTARVPVGRQPNDSVVGLIVSSTNGTVVEVDEGADEFFEYRYRPRD